MMEVEVAYHQGREGVVLKQGSRGDGAKRCGHEGKVIGISDPKAGEL